MNKVIFMVGNIGSGKSNYCQTNDLINIITKDGAREDFGLLIDKEYLWDETLEEFIHDIVLDLFEANLHVGAKEIVLDETFMSKQSRSPFISLALKYGYKVEAIIFKDRGMKEHVDARMTNSRGFNREYWERVWKLKSKKYEKPTLSEGFDDIKDYSWEVVC